MADFYALPTNVGEAKLANALALGIPLQITHLAVGDGTGAGAQGTPIPNPAATTLVSEQRRAPINTLFTDPGNANVLVAEQIIPEEIGGWWIREIGLIDTDGDLIAIANCPPTYKPVLAQGSGRTQVVRLQIIVSDAAAVTLKVDPAVVLATRQYVNSQVIKTEHPLDTTTGRLLKTGDFGIGVAIATTADLDALTVDGNYYCTGSVNRPPGAGDGYLTVVPSINSVSCVQIYREIATERIWVRRIRAGVVGGWVEQWTAANLDFADALEAAGLALGTKILSPAGLNHSFQLFNQSRDNNGYQRLPGGIILQWGTQDNPGPVTLPIAYTTAHLFAMASINAQSNQSTKSQTATILNKTLTSLEIGYLDHSSAIVSSRSWLSIGY